MSKSIVIKIVLSSNHDKLKEQMLLDNVLAILQPSGVNSAAIFVERVTDPKIKKHKKGLK